MHYEFAWLLILQEICEPFQESKQIGNEGHLKFLFIFYLSMYHAIWPPQISWTTIFKKSVEVK